MTYKVFGGTLSLTQSINQSQATVEFSCAVRQVISKHVQHYT